MNVCIFNFANRVSPWHVIGIDSLTCKQLDFQALPEVTCDPVRRAVHQRGRSPSVQYTGMVCPPMCSITSDSGAAMAVLILLWGGKYHTIHPRPPLHTSHLTNTEAQKPPWGQRMR
jgi:hypothetical protein